MGSILLAALLPSIGRRCESPLQCGAAERNCWRFEVGEWDPPLDPCRRVPHVRSPGGLIPSQLRREEVILSMHLTVTGKQTDTGDALRSHVEASLGSILGKYFKTAIEAHVVFSKEAHM